MKKGDRIGQGTHMHNSDIDDSVVMARGGDGWRQANGGVGGGMRTCILVSTIKIKEKKGMLSF